MSLWAHQKLADVFFLSLEVLLELQGGMELRGGMVRVGREAEYQPRGKQTNKKPKAIAYSQVRFVPWCGSSSGLTKGHENLERTSTRGLPYLQARVGGTNPEVEGSHSGT